jgi:hypothetical protein
MRFLCTVLLCGVALAGRAAEPRATATNEAAVVDADKLQFDKPTNTALGEGNVAIRYRDAVLRADKVRYNSVTKEAWAEGHVRLYRAGSEWHAPAAYYNFDTQAFKTDELRGTARKLYVTGERLAFDRANHAALARATLSPCDYEHPHYRLEAKRAEIFGDDRVVMYAVTVYVGNTPVFWLPVLAWSLQADGPPLIVQAGYSGRWGPYLLTTANLHLNRSTDLAVHLDERVNRGPGAGADVNYRYGDLGGLLKGYYLNDRRPEDSRDRAAGRQFPANRYVTHWEHRQTLWPDVTLTLNLNHQSDRDVREDFFLADFRRASEPESVANVTWRGEAHALSVLARPQLNPFYAEVERLPEATFSVNRARLWRTPLYYEGESSAGFYRNVAGDTHDLLFRDHTARADTFHQLVAPALLFDWLSVVPSAGIRGTWYLDAPVTAPDSNEVRRVVWNAGIEVSTKLWRQWDDVRSDRFQINGLRHIVEPFAQYLWVPRPAVTRDELFQFDTVRFAPVGRHDAIPVTRYVPWSFPDNHAIDALDRLNVLRFGVRQKLQTRRAALPWDLVELDAWTDAWLERAHGQNTLGDVHGRCRLRPTAWLLADADVRVDPAAGWQEYNGGLRVAHGDQWAFGLGARVLRDDSSVVAADVAWRLGRFWTAQIYQRADLRDNQWEEQEYVLRQETHDWFVNYGIRHRNERGSGDEVIVFLSFTLKAFPDVKLGFN